MTSLRLWAAFAAALVLAGTGCGSDDEGAPAPASGDSGDDGSVIALLGDSITAGSPGYDPDPAARQAYGFGGDERSSYAYWAERANPGLEFRNCGVFGERTDQIAARLEGCAEGAAGVIVQGGINDIAQGYGSDQPSENLRATVREAKAMGLTVAITDVLPWNNGYPDADPDIVELNSMIAEIAAEEEIPLLPFHDTLEDPGAPGRMKPEWTADGDHPSVAGYRRLGEIAFEQPG